MKLLKYKIFILCVTLLPFTLCAKDKLKKFTKTISESALIDEDGNISINNQFGNINVITSNTNKVDAVVYITIDTKNQEMADDFFERIEIDIDHSSSQFEISSDYENPSWWKTIWSNSNSYKYSIDMEITIPASCDVDLTQRHGDVTMGDIAGDFELDLSFGEAECGSTSGELYVKLEHADANFDQIQDAIIDIQYGEFISAAAKDLEFDSQFSKIFVDEANNVESSSQYDEYHLGKIVSFENEGQFDDIQIDKVQSADLETQYSKIVIDLLADSGDFETQFGSLRVRESTKNLKNISIESQYTQINLNVSAAYILDLESQFASLILDNAITYIDEDKEIGQHDIEAYYLDANSSTNIDVEMQFGSLKLRHE